MRRTYLLLLFGIFVFHQSNAQKKTTISELQIGDQVPDIKISKIFNSTLKTANTSDYKNKLLILDFGNTRCSGCIAALPQMDSLQKAFKNQIQIFWVTYETESEIEKFWKRSKLTQNNSLPTIVEDTVLSTYFRHRIWPHEVWIYKGKVIAITEPEYVDAANIKTVLSGNLVNWPVKNDFYAFNAQKESLFKTDPNQIDTASTMIQYAAISDYKDGINQEAGIGIIRNPKKKLIRTFFSNMPVLNTYLYCYYNSGNLAHLIRPSYMIDPNQIDWKVSDKSKFQYISKTKSGYRQNWLKENGICFESLTEDKGQTDQETYQHTIRNLNQLLGLTVHWEKRQEKVLILVNNGPVTQLKSKRTITDPSEHITTKGNEHHFRDIPLSNIVFQMNQIAENPYVFDETKIRENVDLDLNFSSWKNIQGIQQSLKRYGLDLREELRWIDKLVFEEASYKHGGLLLVDPKIQAKAKARRAAQAGLKNPTPDLNRVFLKVNKKKPGIKALPSGLQYKVLVRGTGPIPTEKDIVKVNYTGMLVNGKIFESSLETGKTSSFKVNEMITGWQEALKLMPVGSKWILYIPAELAYGDRTNSGQIPQNSTLIFELELLQITK